MKILGIVMGILLTISGIFCLTQPVLTFANFWAQLFTDMALIMLFGVWIVCAGVLRIVASVQLKFAWWGFGVFWGVVLILVGIYALLHPVVSLISLGWCVAFVFISQGINLVFAAISTKSEDAA